MRASVARDLADAQVQGLSADRRFATGTTPRSKPRTWPRVRRVPRHGEGWAPQGHCRGDHPRDRRRGERVGDYFETCRRKRYVIDYTRSHVATDSEADEIVNKAREFHGVVETWIEGKFPTLKR